MRYIGDIHGRADLYAKAIAGCDASIQVGDFGYGFIPKESLPLWPGAGNPNHRFIRGNHDDPAQCKAQPNYILSGQQGDHFYINGGWSIDREWRVEGVSWWPDEEHSAVDLNEILDDFIATKPRVVVSHEAPCEIAKLMFGAKYPPGPSRTSIMLQAMLDNHTPDIWIFGHWHKTKKFGRYDPWGNTRFICLGEGDWIDLPESDGGFS